MGFVTDFLFGSEGQAATPAQAFRGPGWSEQGNLLNQIFQGNVLGQMSPEQQAAFAEQFPNAVSPMQGQQFTPGQSIPGFGGAPQALSFNTNRTPFQFDTSFNAEKALQDAFTPAMEVAQRAMTRSGNLERDAILQDMNKRGVLTGGATTQAMNTQREQEQGRLKDIAGMLGSEQAQRALQAQQFQSQFDMNRQMQQAAEIFRQQGASDAQAMALAQNAMGMRQQGVAEFGLQNTIQRQPQQDLFSLYQLSTGGQPGFAGTEGGGGILGPLMGAAGGAFFGPFGEGLGALGGKAADKIFG